MRLSVSGRWWATRALVSALCLTLLAFFSVFRFSVWDRGRCWFSLSESMHDKRNWRERSSKRLGQAGTHKKMVSFFPIHLIRLFFSRILDQSSYITKTSARECVKLFCSTCVYIYSPRSFAVPFWWTNTNYCHLLDGRVISSHWVAEWTC